LGKENTILWKDEIEKGLKILLQGNSTVSEQLDGIQALSPQLIALRNQMLEHRKVFAQFSNSNFLVEFS